MTPALLLPLLALPLAAPGAPPPAAETFPLRDVRILEGPFRDAQRRSLAYLLSLDPDRLLHTFRLNAGLPTSAKPYGGWEAPRVELRGHSLGHYLTACALLYEATGDERLPARAVAIVGELRKVQQALASRGMNPGYLSAFPEEFFDRVEARKGVWAPYYTLHKIMAGLLDVHRTTGDPGALELVKGMAAWVGLRAKPLTDDQWQAMLETEFGGMEDVLTELYVTTRDPEHLRLARLFDHRAVFDPLARGEDPLDGLHANTQIPKAIGAARDCEVTGEPRYCAVSETFWQRVALHRSYAMGGHGEDEHFSPVAHLSRHLGESTAETCNTYNMLKLTRRLFLRDADPFRLDFYERGLFNHVLASNDPATGMVTYYVALAPGAWRTYSTPEDSFWCCVGTGMENPARYGEAIYARQGDALLVNLFLASELAWPEKGLTVRQETRFPDEDGTRLVLRLRGPARFALRLRQPSWATDGLEVSVNGRAQTADSHPGTYVAIEREWRDGDVIEARARMSLRFEATADDTARGALLFGPIVLAADLGADRLDPPARYGPMAPEVRVDERPPVPVLVAASPAEALLRLRPAASALTFRTDGLGRPRDLELRPFFRLADRRHSVYFDVLPESAWTERRVRAQAQAEREAADLAARTVDAVAAGEPADEKAHALEEARSDTYLFEGRRCRAARSGGSFGYALKLPDTGEAALRVTYWGGESRRHLFDVLVEGEVVGTQSLFDDRPGELFPVEYAMPETLRQGRERVRVTFRPAPGRSTGVVYDVRVVRPARVSAAP
ncbi:MAG TPA: beta-L-arabinofuranosidase domain-containing protein [Vicinamibacteria bacterium]|nr:beta-L-arabinofuranosidase domain-containing protein [Vicinamibacteria bacterium]